MLDAIQDRLRKGTVISAKLIIPAIGIILGAEDGRGSPASPMEKLQNVMLFGFSWFQQEPFINDQQDRVGIFPLDFVRGKVILQSQGKEFFTWHGKDFFT